MKKDRSPLVFKLQYIDASAPDNRETYKALKERYQVETTLDTFKLCYLDAPIKRTETQVEPTEIFDKPDQFVSPMIGVQDSLVKEADSQNRVLSAYEPFFSSKDKKAKDAKTIKQQFDLNDTEDYKRMLRGEYELANDQSGYQVKVEDDTFQPNEEHIDESYMQPIAPLYEDVPSTFEYVEEEEESLPFEETPSYEESWEEVPTEESFIEEEMPEVPIEEASMPDLMSELEPTREISRPAEKRTFERPKPQAPVTPQPVKVRKTRYVAPPLNLLKRGGQKSDVDNGWAEAQKEMINKVFQEFNYRARAFDYVVGPTVTLFMIDIEPGTDINKINSFSKSLEMRLKAKSLRILAPIPGMGCAGIEIANEERAMVLMGDLVTKDFMTTDKKLKFVLGLNINGEPVYGDIEKMPHCLVAGFTGSGKSVCVHAMIISLLLHNTPDELRMIMIDPKRVEFTFYEGIPHLAMPVVIDHKQILAAVKWAHEEMNRRYEVLRINRVRDIQSFNSVQRRNGSPIMPQIVIVVDEYPDIVQQIGSELEDYVMNIAAKARAAGIHLVLVMQRPSTDVVKGTLKNNIPVRIALKAQSAYDSNTMLNHAGAEKLLGNGDMIYANGADEDRIQGAFLTDEEITDVCNFLVDNNETNYLIDTEQLTEKIVTDTTEDEEDEKFEEICYYAVRNEIGSANKLMQVFNISFNRANRILLKMENLGILSSTVKGKQREVLVSEDELAEILDRNR